jgi:hypothetical protein
MPQKTHKEWFRLTDARNPDIKPFLSHNGKLLLYHGWSDQLVPAEWTISYYEEVAKVAKKMGGVPKIDKQVRMFLAPRMGQCGGGDGPEQFRHTHGARCVGSE